MQNKNKALAISIVFILVISMATTIVLIPNASAHNPKWEIPTYAYINAGPSPIGVGQTAHVYMWLDAVYGAAGGTTAANSNERLQQPAQDCCKQLQIPKLQTRYYSTR